MKEHSRTKEYNAKLDSKNRLTLRGARSRHYLVIEYEDGTIMLSPRESTRLNDISRKTLQMMDKTMQNLAEGAAGRPVNMEELEELLADQE